MALRYAFARDSELQIVEPGKDERANDTTFQLAHSHLQIGGLSWRR